uniref:CCHC-type domain-containing protein n=1 Tax=Oryza sativa subsp. japonica TaxID=39947 RepID=Q6ZG47_ORYSJ|nr:hypothetical protein [Oryza sativa Japonica Group]
MGPKIRLEAGLRGFSQGHKDSKRGRRDSKQGHSSNRGLKDFTRDHRDFSIGVFVLNNQGLWVELLGKIRYGKDKLNQQKIGEVVSVVEEKEKNLGSKIEQVEVKGEAGLIVQQKRESSNVEAMLNKEKKSEESKTEGDTKGVVKDGVDKGAQIRKWCGKCRSMGHIAKDCVVRKYCVICSKVSHNTDECFVAQQPKPVAKMMRFPNEEKLEELSNFVSFGLKGTGVQISVKRWSHEAEAVDTKGLMYAAHYHLEEIVEVGWFQGKEKLKQGEDDGHSEGGGKNKGGGLQGQLGQSMSKGEMVRNLSQIEKDRELAEALQMEEQLKEQLEAEGERVQLIGSEEMESQELGGDNIKGKEDHKSEEEAEFEEGKKNKRLRDKEDKKILEMAMERKEAKNAFINKGQLDPEVTLDVEETDEENDLDFDLAEILMNHLKTPRSGKKKGRKGNLKICKGTPKINRDLGRRKTRK